MERKELSKILSLTHSCEGVFEVPCSSTTGETLWHHAARGGSAELLQSMHALWSAQRHHPHAAGNRPRCPWDIPDRAGRTPLLVVSGGGDAMLPVAELLLSWSEDAAFKADKRGRLPVHVAARAGAPSEQLVRLLLYGPEHGGGGGYADDASASDQGPAGDAQEGGDEERARRMACAVDACGMTPLHYAAAANDASTCKLLLSLGAPLLATSTLPSYEPSMPCNAGMSALHMAAMNNALSATSVMLNSGANMSTQERVAQWTPAPAPPPPSAWSMPSTAPPVGARATSGLADPRAIVDREAAAKLCFQSSRRFSELATLLDHVSSPLAQPAAEEWLGGSAAAAKAQSAPPALLCCPITMDLMLDPVIISDGFSYERVAIDKWLSVHSHSPTTNLPLAHKVVCPNHALRQAINEWRVVHGLPELPVPKPGGGGSTSPATPSHSPMGRRG